MEEGSGIFTSSAFRAFVESYSFDYDLYEKMERWRADRISALPDELIHRIFSFLDMRQVVQTSILSSRWRYLWLSTPSLTFSLNGTLYCMLKSEHTCNACIPKRNTFMDFVDKVFLILGGVNSRITKFHLSSNLILDPTRVCTWLLAAVELHAQCINLDLFVSTPVELPHRLFTSNIIKFCMRSCADKAHLFRLPESVCTAARIKYLRLDEVTFPQGNTNGELMLSCPILEYLEIVRSDARHLRIFTISAPLLESLEIRDLLMDIYSSCKLKTFTPNLKSLTLKAEWYRPIVDYSIDNPSSLVTANIYFSSNCKAEVCAECLVNVLRGITSVQTLKLSVYSLEVLADVPALLEKLPDSFHNLKHVMFTDRSCTPCFHVELTFLERFPRIATVLWEMYPFAWSSADKVEDWVRNFAFLSMFNCLKTFEFRNFRSTLAEERLLKLLLDRAIVLEEIIIKTGGQYSAKKMRQLENKLLSLPRASSSLRISFQLS